jgi:hypothetical protein
MIDRQNKKKVAFEWCKDKKWEGEGLCLKWCFVRVQTTVKFLMEAFVFRLSDTRGGHIVFSKEKDRIAVTQYLISLVYILHVMKTGFAIYFTAK